MPYGLLADLAPAAPRFGANGIECEGMELFGDPQWALAALPWLKAFHVVAVIGWMAGLLYMFRLFVYHARETEEIVKVRLVVWETRLFRTIASPAMAATWFFGLGMLALQPALLRQSWLHAKLGLVILLTVFHHVAIPLRKRLEAGLPTLSDRAFRILNEVPTLLMIGIVVLVIVRPGMR